MNRLLKAALAALFTVAGAAGASAQEYSDDPYGYGEPDIRQTVARVAMVSGDVAFARGDDPDQWQPADPNIPMTLGDRTWTAAGRLELQVHGGNIVRLAPGTDFGALNLTEDTKQFSLSSGIGSFQIRRLGAGEIFEIDTPNAAITFDQPGDYRIDIGRDGDTRVQVRRGQLIVAAGGGQIALASGQAMIVDGHEMPRYEFVGLSRPDSWDRWVDGRETRYTHVRSSQYVSADIAGIEDLDVYGTWNRIPSHGWVWSPRSVASGWMPYRAGRWMWQDPWGWTWVSSEPWGWAPYHYGRWVVYRSRWYWVPVAPTVAVVAYSPALVAFVGGGPGFSVSVGFGSGYVGWFPLAPRDPLLPWWGRPAVNVNVNVNVTNITYVNRTYVTVVNENTFVGGRSVANNRVRDRAIVNRVENAPVVRGAVPIVPTRESIRVAPGRKVNVAQPPAAIASRQVVSRVAPPPVQPRFDAKVPVIRENRGAPVAPREAERIVSQDRGTARPTRAVRPAAAESGKITLAPKTQDAGGAKPEPVAAPRGRPMSTSERPDAPQPSLEPRSRAPIPARPTPETEARPVPQSPKESQSPKASQSPKESRPATRPTAVQAPARGGQPPERVSRPTPAPAPQRQVQPKSEPVQERAAPAPRPTPASRVQPPTPARERSQPSERAAPVQKDEPKAAAEKPSPGPRQAPPPRGRPTPKPTEKPGS